MRISKLVLGAVVVVAACSGPGPFGADGGTGGSTGGGSGGASGGTGGSAGGGAGGGSGGGTGGGSGGGAGGSAAANELTGALSFPVGSAFTVVGALLDGGPDLSYVQVGFYDTDGGGGCAFPAALAHALVLGVGTGDGSAVTAQTYAFDNQASASPGGGVDLARADVVASGYEIVSRTATGSLTFTALTATHSAGTFDAQLTLADGGTSSLSGRWNAPLCFH